MLKVFGHIYSNSADDFKTIMTSLKNDGFEVAIEGDNSGTIIKDVASLEDTEDAES